MAKSRRRSCNRKRKQQGGNSASWASAVYGSAGNQTAGSGNVIAMKDMSGVNMCTGGNPMRKSGGKGLVTDIAVPAVLLYANQAMKPRRSMGSKKRYHRRSRRTIRRR